MVGRSAKRYIGVKTMAKFRSGGGRRHVLYEFYYIKHLNNSGLGWRYRIALRWDWKNRIIM